MIDTNQLLQSILKNESVAINNKEVDNALNELLTKLNRGEKLEPEEYILIILAFVAKIYSFRPLICEREGASLIDMYVDPTDDFAEFQNKYCRPAYTCQNNVFSWFMVEFYEDDTQGYELINTDERKIKDELKIVIDYYNEAKKWLMKKGYLR